MEVWKDIPSDSSLMASSTGLIMIKPYEASMPHGGVRVYGGHQTKGQWDGARYIYTRRGHKTRKVARLICEAFNGPPPFDDAVCMHLDEDSRNNQPDNLALGTQKENLNAPGFIRYCQGRTGDSNPYVVGKRRKFSAKQNA